VHDVAVRGSGWSDDRETAWVLALIVLVLILLVAH
jgi:hypothetical protein